MEAKIGMLGVINNLGKRTYSHNAGWTYVTRAILSERLNMKVDILSNSDSFENYSAIIINEGVNFKPGVFNFFGGAQEKQINALKRFSNYRGEVFHLNNYVDYTIPCKKRKDLSELSDLEFPSHKVIDISKYFESIIIGDSHSISAWEPGRTIKRMDGKTLNGALNIGLKNLIPSESQKNIQFYFGNIDVRFHFKRFGGASAIENIFERYSNQIRDLKNDGYTITLTQLIPIEDESRKIPNTGKYLGENFFGTQSERLEYVEHFNSLLDELSDELDLDVARWENLDYNGLSFDDMESRQSVHIRPSSYMNFDKLQIK